jgi:hypothetical protein
LSGQCLVSWNAFVCVEDSLLGWCRVVPDPIAGVRLPLYLWLSSTTGAFTCVVPPYSTEWESLEVGGLTGGGTTTSS